MDPYGSRYAPTRLRCLIRAGGCSSCITAPGLQHCVGYLSQHAAPPTPENHPGRFHFQSRGTVAFPIRPLGRHLQSIYEAVCRFTCVTACCFSNWELTNLHAAPLSYRGEFPDGTLTRKIFNCYCIRSGLDTLNIVCTIQPWHKNLVFINPYPSSPQIFITSPSHPLSRPAPYRASWKAQHMTYF